MSASYRVMNWINGKEVPAVCGEWFEKINPHDGSILYSVAASNEADIALAVEAAGAARKEWAETPAVQRGMLLHRIVTGMQEKQKEIAAIVAEETGKSFKDAFGETGGAIQLGLFFAGEGQRLYGRTCTSGIKFRQAMTIRQPVGIAGLIVPANTPIANVAWKLFPALICGNTVVLKAAEDTPKTAWIVAQIAKESGLPDGVFNTVQGLGHKAGAALVEHQDVGVISFTGSTRVGRIIQEVTGRRFAKCSLELGGKNPLVVCDDADLENACNWVVNSSFSNAGQRCASSSRIIIFDAVYDRFKEMLLQATATLKVGPGDDDYLGPVINERQLNNMLAAVERAKSDGAVVLIGGERLQDSFHKNGFYMAPTIMDNVDPDHEISRTELFGPITCLYKVRDFEEAVNLANRSPYGLCACIHTTHIDRAMEFVRRAEAGVVNVNAGTHGSEPHMPFGGVKQSGNGTREPGTEAIDVFSNLKDVYFSVNPDRT